MNIVFYSTTASRFDAATFELYTYPRRAAVWSDIAARHPEHEFYIVTQPPAPFLLDNDAALTSIFPLSTHPRVHAIVLPDATAPESVAEHILALKPDIAIAATGWTPPLDWLGVQDSLVADRLRARGVRVLCHTMELSATCFDKSRTHVLLETLGFAMPKSVYVHHELYWCERRYHELTRNVYKDYVLSKIRALHYPVVIKDTVGLSSYSMEVAVSYKQALAYLNSGRTKIDRIVEEYIAGEQFGAEIYGDATNAPIAPAESKRIIGTNSGEGKSAYTVLPPLMFSLNKYGITSPKQSVKLSGVHGSGTQPDATKTDFCMEDLRAMLMRLAEACQFSGVAQVDLVHSSVDKRWYIIEINPRLSGMSETYAAALDLPLMELLVRTALGLPLMRAQAPLPYQVCNIKLPLLTEAQLSALAQESAVAYLHQIHNRAAKQEREKGYCELVLRAPTLPALMRALDDIAARYADCMESAFVAKAHELTMKIG